MGYLSLIGVRYKERQRIALSEQFGEAVRNATIVRDFSAPITIDGTTVGVKLCTVHANDDTSISHDANEESGELAFAWIYHDELHITHEDPTFGEDFAEMMMLLEPMQLSCDHFVHVNHDGSSGIGAVLFFRLSPSHRVSVNLSGNRADVTSFA